MSNDIYKGDLKIMSQNGSSLISSSTHDFIAYNNGVIAYPNGKQFRETENKERNMIASYSDNVYAQQALRLLADAFEERYSQFTMPSQDELLRLEELHKQKILTDSENAVILNESYTIEEGKACGYISVYFENGDLVTLQGKQFGITYNGKPDYQFSAFRNKTCIEKITDRHCMELSAFAPFYLQIFSHMESDWDIKDSVNEEDNNEQIEGEIDEQYNPEYKEELSSENEVPEMVSNGGQNCTENNEQSETENERQLKVENEE